MAEKKYKFRTLSHVIQRFCLVVLFAVFLLRKFSCRRNWVDKQQRERATHGNAVLNARKADGFSAQRIASEKMVEAGGVEPPSEKRYDAKPTCLSQFGVRPGPCGLIARSPAALGMSKMRNQLVRWFSPEPYGPKGPGQLTV